MQKLWFVARYEYARHALKRGFIVALLSVPLVMLVLVGVTLLAVNSGKNFKPVGYVDHSNFLAKPVPLPEDRNAVPIIAFGSENEAKRALESGDIQAYYVLPADYEQTTKVQLFYDDPPGENAGSDFFDFMQLNWLSAYPSDIVHRVTFMSNDQITVRTPDGTREFNAGSPTVRDFLPLMTGFIFMLLMSFGSSYFVGAIAEEKENRVMELMVTSVSPGQLMAGKMLGAVAVMLTQVVAWLVFLVAMVFVAADVFNLTAFQNLGMDGQTALVLALVMLPGYVMYAGLMMAAGATVAESQEAQQVTGLFVLPIVAPMWLMVPLIENPRGPLAVFLTLFPLTAPSAIGPRIAFTALPWWQLAASVAILIASAAAAIWLAARAFRLGLLRYGKRISLRELIGRREIAAPVAAGGRNG